MTCKIQPRLGEKEFQIFSKEKQRLESEIMVKLTDTMVINKMISEWEKIKEENERMIVELRMLKEEKDKQKKKVA